MSWIKAFWARSRNWPAPGQIAVAVLIGLVAAAAIGALTATDHPTASQRPIRRSTTVAPPSSSRTRSTTSTAPAPSSAVTTATVAAATTTVRATTSVAPTNSGLIPLVIAPPSHADTYNRDEDFGAFIDADHDCQDTRAEVLIRTSQAPVTFTTARDCTVKTGRWTDPWSGAVRTVAHDLQIDHTVPLANAWASGAWAWTHEQRIAYANDLIDADHLVPILASENESKSDGGPDRWRPPDATAWCRYALDWDRIKAEWHLAATSSEWSALTQMASSC